MMKIIFLNTWRGKLHDELRAYVQKNLHDTDVFCFQEARESGRIAYEDLLKDFTRCYVDKGAHEGDHASGNVLYIRADLTVTDTGSLFVDDNEAGLANYATIQKGATLVTICNVHGAAWPSDKLDSPVRIRQSETIINAFDSRQNVIVGGDFNLLPDTQSVKLFSDNSYRNLISEYDIKSTRNRITYELFPHNIQYHADYAFVSPSVIVRNFVVPTEIVSDHQPLELTVGFIETL